MQRERAMLEPGITDEVVKEARVHRGD